MRDLPGIILKIGQEAAARLAQQLGISVERADALVQQARRTRGGLEFVAETRIHTATEPAGYHAGATRYLLSQIPDRHYVKLTVLVKEVAPIVPPHSRNDNHGRCVPDCPHLIAVNSRGARNAG